MTHQELCDRFYDLGNLVTVRVTMDPAHWKALRTAEPHGGRCNFGWTGDRYDWFEADHVEISGSTFPDGGPHRFDRVGISKKSYCGSFSTTRPSVRMDFCRFLDTNSEPVEALIGSQHVTLHNCSQDPSYVRQPLGYQLFRLAGLPYSRCNLGRLVINGDDQGLFVNIEPIRKRYLQHAFGNDRGNLYELEYGEDLAAATLDTGRVSCDGFSGHSDLKDLRLAARRIAEAGYAGAAEVVDLAQFTRFYAMETLVKHWDGYTAQTNNTYVYNDVQAVAEPTVDTVNLKFVPWGLDQILQARSAFTLDDDAVLSALTRKEPAGLAAVRAQLSQLLDSVFGRDSYADTLEPLVARLHRTVVDDAGVHAAAGEIDAVGRQLRLVRSGGYQLLGDLSGRVLEFRSRATGDRLRASADETVGGHQEVDHAAPTAAASGAERWSVQPGGVAGAWKLVNEQYGTCLHASTTVRTAGGHLDVYAAQPDAASDPGDDFFADPVDRRSEFEVSGYLTLRSRRTGDAVRFSDSDRTPAGHGQVHQAPKAEATPLQVF
jgi:hypothetical protein